MIVIAYLANELCSTILTSNLVQSNGILTSGVFILESTIVPMNAIHQLSNVMNLVPTLLWIDGILCAQYLHQLICFHCFKGITLFSI